MDVWSAKKRAVLLIVIGVILIAVIVIPIVIIQLNSVPDIEEFIRVNNLENAISEFGSVTIKQGGSLIYFEKTDEYFNYAYDISSGEISQMYYAVNGKEFEENDGKFYYNHFFDEKRQESNGIPNSFSGFEFYVKDAPDNSVIKKKGGKYLLTFEKDNGYDSNKIVFEFYFNKNLYLYKTKHISNGKTAEEKFTYGEKIDYPEYIKNYDSGDRVTVKVIDLLANKTEEFELKKGSLFHVIYTKINKPYELYLDEACTTVYGAGSISTEPVKEDITIYIGEKITK